MAWALTITVLGVVAGTALALATRRNDRWMGPIRTFAMTAALTVVLLHLLPSSLDERGALAAVVFLAGLLAPGGLERLGALVWSAGQGKRDPHLALEASYAGLLLHRVGDGLGLGVFTGELRLSPASGGIVTALAAHAVPVVALVVLTFDSVRGRRVALGRAAGLAVAGVVGVVLAQTVLVDSLAEASEWVAPFVGGMLLHVVFHDLGANLPTTRGQCALDVLAGAVGLLTGVFGLEGHHEGHGEVPLVRVFDALLDLTARAAPALLVGLFLTAAVASLLHARSELVWARPDRPWVERAEKAKRLGRPDRAVLFLVGGPHLMVETVVVGFWLLGPVLGGLRVALGLLLGWGGGWLIRRVALPEDGPLAESASADSARPGFRETFDESFQRVLPGFGLALVLAAVLEVALPPVRSISPNLQLLVVLAAAPLVFFRAPAGVPFAAVLLSKGVASEAVLLLLMLGPSLDPFVMRSLSSWVGRRRTAQTLLLIGAAALLASWAGGRVVHHFAVAGPGMTLSLGRGFSYAAAGVWATLVVRASLRLGIRGLLVNLLRLGAHEHH